MTVSTSLDDAALRERLLGMTSATATNMLNLRGYQNQFMTAALCQYRRAAVLVVVR